MKPYTIRTIRNRKTELNDDLYNRILNCKFDQATHHIKKEPKPVQDLILALAMVLQNIGWEQTKQGLTDYGLNWEDIREEDLRTILKHALANINYTGPMPLLEGE